MASVVVRVAPTAQAGFGAACTAALTAANLPAAQNTIASKILTFYTTLATAGTLGTGNYWATISYRPGSGVGSTATLTPVLGCTVTSTSKG